MQDGEVDLSCFLLLLAIFHAVEKLAADAFGIKNTFLLCPNILCEKHQYQSDYQPN